MNSSLSSNITLHYFFLNHFSGVEKGFYARVSRLGAQWLELDLHFLSLGGGEIALGWWFEEALVPYLVSTDKLDAVNSISIVTGYGKTRLRGARQGDDGMRKRVRAMLKFMKIEETPQPNRGRVHIDKQKLIEEVKRNNGRIIFDLDGYMEFKERETTANKFPDVEQKVRPRYRPADPHHGGPPFIRVETDSTSPEFRRGDAHAPQVEHLPPAQPNAPENFERPHSEGRAHYPEDAGHRRYDREPVRRGDRDRDYNDSRRPYPSGSRDRESNYRNSDGRDFDRRRSYDSRDRRGSYNDDRRYDSRRGGRRGGGNDRYNGGRDHYSGRPDYRNRRSSSYHGDDRRRPADDRYSRPPRDDRYNNWEPPAAASSDDYRGSDGDRAYDDHRDRRDYDRQNQYPEAAVKQEPSAPPVREEPAAASVPANSDGPEAGKKRGYGEYQRQQSSRGYSLEPSVTKRGRTS